MKKNFFILYTTILLFFCGICTSSCGGGGGGPTPGVSVNTVLGKSLKGTTWKYVNPTNDWYQLKFYFEENYATFYECRAFKQEDVGKKWESVATVSYSYDTSDTYNYKVTIEAFTGRDISTTTTTRYYPKSTISVVDDTFCFHSMNFIRQ